jgi:hypothetical protein
MASRLVALFCEHVDYTYLVAMGMLQDFPPAYIEAHTERLLRNQEELGGGTDTLLTRLLKKHIVLGADIIDHMVHGEPTTTLMDEWYDNGRDCCKALNVDAKWMLSHLNQTLAYIEAMNADAPDWVDVLRKVDEARQHMVMLGVLLAEKNK